ncbi:MAG: helix-turn-helix transcriptional regulator [Alphaproteobacteria bacterium]
MNTKEAAQYLGISKSKMEKMRVKGDGPIFLKLGSRVLYEKEALDLWAKGRSFQSTTEYRHVGAMA